MGGLNDEVKLHLVDWDTVCSPIFEGGLGIQNVRKFNQALLVNGYGGTPMRRGHGGDRFWWPSMDLLGVDSTPVTLLSLKGWGFGSLYVWGGAILRDTLDLT